MEAAYQPKGRVKILLDAMRLEPARVWSVPEIADLIEIRRNEVMAYVGYALKAQAIYRGRRAGLVVFSMVPVTESAVASQPAVAAAPRAAWDPENDPRIPRMVPGWQPPAMVPPRAGSCR